MTQIQKDPRPTVVPSQSKGQIDPRKIQIKRHHQPAPPVAQSHITVIHDPKHTLGKKFTLNPDGTISKSNFMFINLYFLQPT